MIENNLQDTRDTVERSIEALLSGRFPIQEFRLRATYNIALSSEAMVCMLGKEQAIEFLDYMKGHLEREDYKPTISIKSSELN